MSKSSDTLEKRDDFTGEGPRLGMTDAFWRSRIKVVLRNIFAFTFIVILLLILGDLSYISGSTYHQRDRAHALKILVVDNDGSDVGEAVKAAYLALEADKFLSLEWAPPAHPYSDELATKEAVCSAQYWGALYIDSGATERLAWALNASDTQQTSAYDAADAIKYIYNGVRWPSIASLISADLQALVVGSRAAYYHTPGGAQAMQSLNRSDLSAVAAYLNPIAATPNVIQSTQQGSAAFFTTINMLIPQLVAVFINIIMNMSMVAGGIFRDMRTRDVWAIRFVAGKVYAVFAGIAVAGYIWAFREDWQVSAGQFFETWLVYILFLDINWQVYDALLGSYIPMAWVSLFIITWILTNLASCDLPMELQAGWYRVGWAFPAHSTWLMLIQIWSKCANREYQALPILFAWSVVGHVAVPISIRKRCRDARKPDYLETMGMAIAEPPSSRELSGVMAA